MWSCWEEQNRFSHPKSVFGIFTQALSLNRGCLGYGARGRPDEAALGRCAVITTFPVSAGWGWGWRQGWGEGSEEVLSA